jgi:hypothetical protein
MGWSQFLEGFSASDLDPTTCRWSQTISQTWSFVVIVVTADKRRTTPTQRTPTNRLPHHLTNDIQQRREASNVGLFVQNEACFVGWRRAFYRRWFVFRRPSCATGVHTCSCIPMGKQEVRVVSTMPRARSCHPMPALRRSNVQK